MYFFCANVRSIINGKEFKNIFLKIAVKEKFPSYGSYAEGNMYYRGHKNVAGVYVDWSGIFIYSYGVCECKIEWSSVRTILDNQRDEKHTANLSVLADQEVINIRIPWNEEFSAVWNEIRSAA